VSDAVTIAAIAAGSAIAGGGVWTFLGNWLNVGHTKRKDELTHLKGEVGSLREELATCEGRHGILETRLRAVEQRNGSYFALWIKDRHRRLVWLNDKAFLTLFAPLGYARDELDGKTFADLLDPAAAAEIEQLDRAALAHPGATQSILLQLHPDLQFMVVIKVAAIAESGDVQYEGCAYSPGDPEIRSAAGSRRQIIQRAETLDRLIEGNTHDDGR
jgi:PAS domain-containing protein